MKGANTENASLMSVLFSLVLFLVFVLCALMTVMIGSRVYENITARSDENFESCTALSYAANKVRQGDRAGKVSVIEQDGIQVLELSQELAGSEYVTWIYWMDGSVRELFTSPGSGLGLEDGIEILECPGLSFSKERQLVTVSVPDGDYISLALRTAE